MCVNQSISFLSRSNSCYSESLHLRYLLCQQHESQLIIHLDVDFIAKVNVLSRTMASAKLGAFTLLNQVDGFYELCLLCFLSLKQEEHSFRINQIPKFEPVFFAEVILVISFLLRIQR